MSQSVRELQHKLSSISNACLYLDWNKDMSDDHIEIVDKALDKIRSVMIHYKKVESSGSKNT